MEKEHMKNTTGKYEKQNWEGEFYYLMNDVFGDYGEDRNGDVHKIKSFIRQEIRQAKIEGLKRGQAIAVLFKGNEMLTEFQKEIRANAAKVLGE